MLLNKQNKHYFINLFVFFFSGKSNIYVAPYPKENLIYISSFDKCSKFRPDGTKLDTINYDSSTHFGISGMAIDWVAGKLL